MKNKLLFFQWEAFMQIGIENALKRLNVNYDVFTYHFTDWDQDHTFIKAFQDYLAQPSSESIHTVFSVNFSPLISDVCQSRNIQYISWVYDAPINIRKTDSLKNPCNQIYFFDRQQAEDYAKQGIKNVHHLPLAADTEVFSSEGVKKIKEKRGTLETNLEEKLALDKLDCDVALLGKLYQSDFDYLCGPLDKYTRGYLDGIVMAQQEVSGGYLIDQLITDQLIDYMNQSYQRASNGTFQVQKAELEYTLACEVTARNRFTALALLGKRCHVNLYSNQKDERLTQIHNMGYADYYTQMPEIFRHSKINLNMSLTIIKTGIPLRVIDVLGCGGFLLCNCQPEVLEYFEPGVDLVVYENMKDLVDKVQYYLSHEEERKQIARNGFQKVKEKFNFDQRLRVMLDIEALQE